MPFSFKTKPDGDRSEMPRQGDGVSVSPSQSDAVRHADSLGDDKLPPTKRVHLDWLEAYPWLVSFCVHATFLLLLGMITFGSTPGRATLRLLASLVEDGESAEVVRDASLSHELDWREGVAIETETPEAPPMDVTVTNPKAVMISKVSGDAEGKPEESPKTFAPEDVKTQDKEASHTSGGGLDGRKPGARAGLAGRRGGTRQSEEAVERGLRWLVAHQREDGAWCFDLQQAPCNGMCSHSGEDPSTTAATALAILPFLGAGYTHKEGEYQEVVKKGLYYLSTRARVTPQGVDLQDGSSTSGMYGQAMATVAYCEAYAMTHDEALRDIAQGALRFIVAAQDLSGGGWRYTPGTPGDMTVTGWQLMALKSGQLAKLDVPSPTVGLVTKFLDSVQFEGGARYGYMTPTPRDTPPEATTAVGLLCRMYTGWRRDNPALYQGVAYLHHWGMSKTNMYYNYYAAQVLHHWEGPEWEAWNERLREYLIASQATASHEAGSWFFPDHYGDRGGRLYNTAFAILTLEVYYRYLPLYGQAAVQESF